MSTCEICGQEHAFVAITNEQMDRLLETKGLELKGLMESVRYLEANGIYRHLIPKDSPYLQFLDYKDDSLECFFNRELHKAWGDMIRDSSKDLQVEIRTPSLDNDPSYFFHDENVNVGGTARRWMGTGKGDTAKTNPAAQTCASVGRFSTGRVFVKRLWGVRTLPTDTVTVIYRGIISNSVCVAHMDSNFSILNEDGTVATTLGTGVANSGNLSTTEGMVSGTFTIPSGVTVRDTQYLAIEVFIEVTTLKTGRTITFFYEGSSLAESDQSRMTTSVVYGNEIPEKVHRGVVIPAFETETASNEKDFGFTTSPSYA